MKDIVNKLISIEKETSSERGDYDLFALFLREDASNKWDILAAASWIDDDRKEALNYIAQKIQTAFTPDELLKIARVVLIEDNNTALPALQQAINTEHNLVEVKDAVFFGIQIKHAFLITSKKAEPA